MAVKDVIVPGLARQFLQRAVIVLRLIHRITPAKEGSISFLKDRLAVGKRAFQWVIDGDGRVVPPLRIHEEAAARDSGIEVKVAPKQRRQDQLGG